MADPGATGEDAGLWSQLGPDVRTLETSTDRGARRAALMQLRTALLDGGHHSRAAARAFFTRRLQGQLLTVIGEDPVEKCRELGASLLVALLDCPGFLPEEGKEGAAGAAAAAAAAAAAEDEAEGGHSGLLAAYLPVLRSRIVADGGGEGSEEVRLLLLRALNALLACPRCWPHALRHPVRGQEGGQFGELAAVLARALADPYPDAKREACTAVGLAARYAPAQLRLHQATLLKPVLGALGHQHARIRALALHALGHLMAVGNDNMAVLLEEQVHPVLRRLVFDRTPSVRRELVRVVGGWLGQPPGEEAAGPYCFEACEPELLLVLLLLLSDESPGEVAPEARAQALAAGRAWTARRRARQEQARLSVLRPQGWEGGPGEEMEIEKEPYVNKEGEEEDGLRCMVQALFSRSLLPRALDDVGHWTLRMRHRAVLLLADLVSLAGEGPVTACLPVVMGTLLSTLVADGAEAEVAAAVEEVARAVAQMVAPGSMLDELLPHVRGERGAQAVHRAATLRLLRPCLLQAAQGTRPLSEQEAEALAAALADPGLAEEPAVVGGALAAALYAAAGCPALQCGPCRQLLVRAALPLLALPQGTGPRTQALEALTALATATEGGEEQPDQAQEQDGPVQRLMRAHFPALLADVTAKVQGLDRLELPGRVAFDVAFDVLLRECPRGAAVHWQLAGPVLAQQLGRPLRAGEAEEDKRTELRLSHLLVLDALLRDRAFVGTLAASDATLQDVAEMLLPNLVWRAGRAEATARKAALMALHALLRGSRPAVPVSASAAAPWLGPALRGLLPSLRTALEEYDATARELAALCLEGVLSLSSSGIDEEAEAEAMAPLLPDLLKRLDDPSEEVRRAACNAMVALLGHGLLLQPEAVGAAVDQLLIHLGDERVQASVARVLAALLVRLPAPRRAEVEERAAGEGHLEALRGALGALEGQGRVD